MLSLPEQIFLVALGERGGISAHQTRPLEVAIATATLYEFQHAGRALATKDSVALLPGAALSGRLEAAWKFLHDSGQPIPPYDAILRLWSHENPSVATVVEDLVARGLLGSATMPARGFFRRRRYQVVDPDARTSLLDELRAAVKNSNPPPRTAALLALTDVAGVVETYVPSRDMLPAKYRLESAEAKDPVHRAAKDLIASLAGTSPGRNHDIS